MHAELRIGDSRIMVNDAMMGGKGPKALGGSPASFWVYVEDCDALFNRADRGRRPGRTRRRWARCRISSGAIAPARFTDPHGYIWTIATRKEDLTPQEMQQRQAEWMKQFAAQPANR